MTALFKAAAAPAPAVSSQQQERQAYRAGQRRRSVLISSASSIVLLAVLVLATVSSPGWHRVQQSFFDGASFKSSIHPVLVGLLVNVKVLVVCEVLVLMLGLGVAVLRTLRGPIFFPIRFLAAAYTDVFRGLPLIILLYLVGFGVPGLRLSGVPKDATVLGGAAIVITYTAYVAEVFRAGIESVHPSQRAAARSLGLTYAQTMRRVVLPQAVRSVLPALLNDFVALQKDVGLISVLGTIIDAIRAAQIEVSVDGNFTPYVVAGLAFVVLAIPTARVADYITLRSIRRRSGNALV